MSKRNVVIYVAGQRFSLSTEESDEYVISIGERVDVMMKGIQKDNPRLNRDACATMVALSLCDDETKLRRKLEELRGQIKDYLKDSEELRRENQALRARIDELLLREESAKGANAEPVKEEKAPAPAAKKEVTPPASRHVAFVGKDFRSEKKNNNNNMKKDFSPAIKPQGKNIPQNSPQNKEPAPFYKKQEPATPAATTDEKGLPDEPPFQYSIFDTDFI